MERASSRWPGLDLPPGAGMMVVATSDKPMALFNVDGHSSPSMRSARIAANRWPTAGCPAIIAACPGHGWPFEVRSGQPDHPGGYAVAADQVKVVRKAFYVGSIRP